MRDEEDPRAGRGRRGRGTIRRRPNDPCLNCGDPTPGRYCRNCGQAKREVVVSVGALVMEVLEDQFILHKALPLTLANLVFRPGRLTVEYVNGRVVRYIAPFRLYLVSSVVFFLLLSFVGLRALERVTTVTAEGAIAADSVAAGLAEEAGSPGELQPWARNMDVTTGFGAASDSAVIRHVRDRYGRLPGRLALQAFLADFVEYMPHAVFLLLPVFAAVLKLLYIRHRRFYTEHFIFSLHVHAFVFLMFTIALLARNWIVANVLMLWALVYIWMAMKRVYGQGWFRTSLKYCVLGCTYFMLLTFSLMFAAFATVLL